MPVVRRHWNLLFRAPAWHPRSCVLVLASPGDQEPDSLLDRNRNGTSSGSFFVVRVGGQVHVANMELLIDVGQLPASVFEEGFANEDERAREKVEKDSPEKDRERPAVFAEKECPVRD